jgi:hypothetical protein
MLTGALPYEGRTTAQLAAQHLHSRPLLDRLPAGDRATIARALSKDPLHRFPSCREMIDNLLRATMAPSSPAARHFVGPEVRPLPLSPSAATEGLSAESIAQAAAEAKALAASITQATEPAPQIRDLPPLELKPQDPDYRPTIFIGLGGLGARTIQTLHRRLVNRFGPLDGVPALQFLAFDTNAETLEEITQRDRQTPLGNESAIVLPLRQAAEYRRAANHRLQWLSRRWIYNISRSLQTQGFRPLGRLALVDHLDRVVERIGRAIKAALTRDGLATSARTTGLQFRNAPPRIFVVSSISGGTGSGMALDVAYLVRQILRELGLSEAGLCGILAHCAGHHVQGRELAVANSYAFLTELHHCSDVHHGYPGDPAIGLPTFPPEDAPFPHAYVINLGEDLAANDFAAAADKLAKYLYCSAVTPAGVFFDQCRAPAGDGEPSCGAEPLVRSFGLAQLGFSYDDIPAATIAKLCKTLVTRWRCGDRAPADAAGASMADPAALLAEHFSSDLTERDYGDGVAFHLEQAGLDIDRIVDHLCDLTLREMGSDPQSYLLAVLKDLLAGEKSSQGNSASLPLNQTILNALDALIRAEGFQNTPRVCLESVLDAHLNQLAAERADVLREWILGLVIAPEHRLVGAQRAVECVAEHLRTLTAKAGEGIQDSLRQLASLKQSLLGDKSGGRDWLRSRGFAWKRRLVADPRLCQYFHLRIEELLFTGARRLVGLMLGHVAVIGDKLRNLAADLNRLVEEFGCQADANVEGSSAGVSERGSSLVTEMIAPVEAELIAEIDRAMREELHRVAATGGSNALAVLPPLLRRTAREVIHGQLKKVTVREIVASASARVQNPVFSLAAGLSAAAPALIDCGGAQRLLLVAPEGILPAQLLEQLGDGAAEPPTVIADEENEVLLCYELEQLSLRRVAAAVLDRRFKSVEVAARLHTRIDVPWSAL